MFVKKTSPQRRIGRRVESRICTLFCFFHGTSFPFRNHFVLFPGIVIRYESSRQFFCVLCVFAVRHAPVCYASGSAIVNVLPFPIVLSTVTSPLWARTICLTIESPRPVPPSFLLRALSTR